VLLRLVCCLLVLRVRVVWSSRQNACVRKGFQKKKGKRQMPMCLFHFSFVSLNPEAFISRSKNFQLTMSLFQMVKLFLKDSGFIFTFSATIFFILKIKKEIGTNLRNHNRVEQHAIPSACTTLL